MDTQPTYTWDTNAKLKKIKEAETEKVQLGRAGTEHERKRIIEHKILVNISHNELQKEHFVP